LIQLIENWDWYKKKPKLFQEENLASLNTTRKMYALAKFYGQESHAKSLAVLRDWLASGDGS
jgi:hypothetical protein